MMISHEALDHFENPRNAGTLDRSDPAVGTGQVGTPSSAVVRLQVRIVDEVIEAARFKTFGCGAAIAASSLAAEWLEGRRLSEARGLGTAWIVSALALPPAKIHCSLLAADAVAAAIADYERKHPTHAEEEAPAPAPATAPEPSPPAAGARTP